MIWGGDRVRNNGLTGAAQVDVVIVVTDMDVDFMDVVTLVVLVCVDVCIVFMDAVI